MSRKLKCKPGYDFVGWATRADMKCSDGRTIMKGAFADCDGMTVPLIWNHDHDDPMKVIGHALLENVDEGVIAHGKFNDTDRGITSKKLVQNSDVVGLSIYANKLRQQGGNVLHGKIREVSLVLAGANPGAYIEDVMAHADGTPDEAIIFNDDIDLELYHAESTDTDYKKGESTDMANEETKNSKEKTIQEVFDTLTDKQKEAVYAVIGYAVENAKNDNKEESDDMKHNVFESNEDNLTGGICLTHSDLIEMRDSLSTYGTMRQAYRALMSELQHDDNEPVEYVDRNGDTINYNLNGSGNPYFLGNYEYLFPEARLVGDRPFMIERDTGWVSDVVNAAVHSPVAKIKTITADITEKEARARGYIKGDYKEESFWSLMRRQTGPTTIYVKQSMDRDDIEDIIDWDVIAHIKMVMRKLLDEEIARAVLIGDGRLSHDREKIKPDCVRPIAYDDDLYTVKVTLPDTTDATVSTGDYGKDLIRSMIKNRKLYKGSGSPTFFTTEDALSDMLLITDEIGHFMYKSEAELATTLRVKKIVTVPVMENNADNIVGIMVNMQDYTIGANKGGKVGMFDDFDIDYNKMKYLMETRISGALTRPYSAMVFKKHAATSEEEEQDNG